MLLLAVSMFKRVPAVKGIDAIKSTAAILWPWAAEKPVPSSLSC